METPAATEPRRPFGVLRRDISRSYEIEGPFSSLGRMFFLLDNPGLHAVMTYRYGSWVNRHVRLRLLRIPLKAIHYILQKLCIIFWGIFIDDGAHIGAGLYIGHFGGIIIGPARMGRDCNINHQVTIGVRADGAPGLPVFGDRVWIGVGSVVYGNITIGDGVTIAPNTVVSRSLPPRVVVSGNPMRVVAKDYDNTQAIYGRPGTSTLVVGSETAAPIGSTPAGPELSDSS